MSTSSVASGERRKPRFLLDFRLSLDGTTLPVKRHRRMNSESIASTEADEEALRDATWISSTYYCLGRALNQQIRNSTSFFFEIGVGALAGGIIGLSANGSGGHLFQGIYHPPFTILSSAVDYQSTPQLALLGGMAIGLAASAPGFWVFGEEKMMFRRETAAGHSRSAYYIGKMLSTLPRIALSSLHFTVFMGILATPLISFTDMWMANLGYFWCVYGLAGIVSMLVKREDGPLVAVLASLVVGMLSGVAPNLREVKGWGLEWFWRMSPGVWYAEAYWSRNLAPLGYLYDLDMASKVMGFTIGQYGLDVFMLFVIGAVYRVLAYLALVLFHQKQT